MKNKIKIVKINGLKGLLLLAFVLGCLVTGFVLFPSWLCMQTWNFFAGYAAIPAMTLTSGALLWAIIALSLFAVHLQKPMINLGSASKLNEDEMRNFLKTIQENPLSDSSEIDETDAVKK